MLETIYFRKATYIDTNLLHYVSFNRDAMKFTRFFFNFSLPLTLLAKFKKPFDIALDLEPEKLFDIALDVEPEKLFDIALDVEP